MVPSLPVNSADEDAQSSIRQHSAAGVPPHTEGSMLMRSTRGLMNQATFLVRSGGRVLIASLTCLKK